MVVRCEIPKESVMVVRCESFSSPPPKKSAILAKSAISATPLPTKKENHIPLCGRRVTQTPLYREIFGFEAADSA